MTAWLPAGVSAASDTDPLPEFINFPPPPPVVFTTMVCTGKRRLPDTYLRLNLCKLKYDKQDPPRAATGLVQYRNDDDKDHLIDELVLWNDHEGKVSATKCPRPGWIPPGKVNECYHKKGYSTDTYGVQVKYYNPRTKKMALFELTNNK
ncbi:hypothetical protein [Micromonospora auratinigra]|nr:hypothetical protein [Micromonospora auratinigra]